MDRPEREGITKRPLFYWIINRFRGLQLCLLCTIVFSLFFGVLRLEMQRRIINEAISLQKLELLYFYCGIYIAAVLIAALMKYCISVFQAIIGQKILIELRCELYNHILQLPLPFFQRTKAGTIASAMTSELNAIGTFLGGALAIPITSFLTFLVFAGYMIYLNPLLGLISIAVSPFELFIIPILQRRYNHVNRTRKTTTRAMVNLVNEASSGIHEVQGNSSYGLERIKLDRLIARLYVVMRRLSLLKYSITFSKNLFQNLGQFLLFLIGGVMIISGEFTIGALVAFLSAFNNVYDPWKDIIQYYKEYQDTQVRYQKIMELFDNEPEYLLEAPDRSALTLKGHIEARDVGCVLNGSVHLLDNITFTLPAGKHLALVGYSGSGKSTLSLLLGQHYSYTNGLLTIDQHNVSELSKSDISKNISFVAQHPFIFTGTVQDNLLYSCNALHVSGHLDILPGRNELMEMISNVGLSEDLIHWSLRTVIPPKHVYPLIDKFLRMRKMVLEELRDEFTHVVEFYDSNEFLEHSNLGINLTFSSYPGSPQVTRLLDNQAFRDFLKAQNFENDLCKLGLNIATTTISFLGSFQNDAFFFQGSPMEPDQFAIYERLVKKTNKTAIKDLNSKDKDLLLSLALVFTPGKHKIYTISKSIKHRLIELRHLFLQNVLGIDLEQCRNGVLQRTIYDMAQVAPKQHKIFFTPFCASQYLYSHSLLDNIIFGTVIEKDVVQSTLAPLALGRFKEQGLLDEVCEIGLNFHVGSKGERLSGGQKQKIAIARALLKQSPLLILDEATASLDNRSQSQIQHYIETHLKGNTTVVAVVHHLDMISEYDHILVMKAGKVVESGEYTELMDQKGILYELVHTS